MAINSNKIPPKGVGIHSTHIDKGFFGSIQYSIKHFSKVVYLKLFPLSSPQKSEKNLTERNLTMTRGSESLFNLKHSEVFDILKKYNYSLDELSHPQREAIKEMALAGHLPNINVTLFPIKCIREFIDIYIANKDNKENIAPSIFQAYLGKVLNILIKYSEALSEKTFRGDDYDVDFSRLDADQKKKFFTLVIHDKISIDLLNNHNTQSLKEYLSSQK